MKVIFFTKYTRKGASSRLRTFQYIDYFTSIGIECTVSPFFNDAYLAEVYASRHHSKWQSLKSFWTRVFTLLSITRYNHVVIEKELFPYFPAVFEWILKVLGVKYIVDYDDAIFHNYDLHPNRLSRWLLKNKISHVMRYASHVSVGNEYLMQKAVQSGAKRITIIPTVIDITKYQPRTKISRQTFTIGWIGSPITAKYLEALKPVFHRLSLKHPIRLKLIGVKTSIGLPEIEDIVPWNEGTENEEITTFDVGIMPLEDNIWERGKCGYKLIQYMGCGLPVIGTPIGVNKVLITDGWNGYKAITPSDWEEALERLVNAGPEKRMQLGANGRKLVEEEYSLQKYAKKYAAILLNE
jgi:glycosyltransferase involved in cell wall biosynthesis